MTLHTFRLILPLLFPVLALTGCATTTPLQQQTLRVPAADEGVVVGSVWIKGGKDLLGRTGYDLVVNKADKTTFIAPDYTIEAQREGEEEVFAAVMPAGDYRIAQLRQRGFSNFVRNTNIQFRVERGKTTYIGRLRIEFPPETITIFTPIRLTVENAKDTIATTAKRKYGSDFADATVRLMTTAQTGRLVLPGRTTADSRLENDTLTMIMGMDGAHDPACKQRTLSNREIISADSKGAQEHWTLNRCGTLVRYRITYSPGPGGGTLIGYTSPEVIGKAQ